MGFFGSTSWDDIPEPTDEELEMVHEAMRKLGLRDPAANVKDNGVTRFARCLSLMLIAFRESNPKVVVRDSVVDEKRRMVAASIEASDLVCTDLSLFTRAASYAKNVDIFPKTNGKVCVDLGVEIA